MRFRPLSSNPMFMPLSRSAIHSPPSTIQNTEAAFPSGSVAIVATAESDIGRR